MAMGGSEHVHAHCTCVQQQDILNCFQPSVLFCKIVWCSFWVQQGFASGPRLKFQIERPSLERRLLCCKAVKWKGIERSQFSCKMIYFTSACLNSSSLHIHIYIHSLWNMFKPFGEFSWKDYQRNSGGKLPQKETKNALKTVKKKKRRKFMK